MAANSSIEWTEATWNPVTGCTKVSPGCKNCYAERMSKRLQAMGNNKYSEGFRLALHHNLIDTPLAWTKARMIFVNSMSDLFHKDVPSEFIIDVFTTMNEAHWHTFQILTKRSRRLTVIDKSLEWAPNIWMGVSVENEDCQFRIDDLRRTRAEVKFLSLEPLLGPIPDINLDGIDWVIVGGESGPRARPINRDWVVAIRDKCISEEVPFFFKQWGGFNKKKNGRLLEGKTWNEMPVTINSQAVSIPQPAM